jgi:endonuclease G
MATVYVIHDERDRAFVESTLLPPLPSLGFDRWISSTALPDAGSQCNATIVVVSGAAVDSPQVRQEIRRGLQMIPVSLDSTPLEQLGSGLASLPRLDLSGLLDATEDLALRLQIGLAQMLPPIDVAGLHHEVAGSEPIPWREGIFSGYLQRAMSRHDFNRGQTLLAALARHLQARNAAYPAESAQKDLGTLRKKRQFELMRRYADLVVSSGDDDPQVRRQLAQALIEQGQFDRALDELHSIVTKTDRSREEWFEAHGLIGRVYKQQYVNDPSGARDQLRRAVDEYQAAYEKDPSHLWHGINAVSLRLRAARDGHGWADPGLARDMAGAILRRLDAATQIPVWDRATRVEALIALERFGEAEKALDEYLTHPDMDAFEVSSTYRQFDQVLQLTGTKAGRPLHERLWRAVDRYRAGGAWSTPSQRPDAGAVHVIPMIVRVSNPDWAPSTHVPDLDIDARLGTVISIRGSRATVQALLKDPSVIAVEESRPVATAECEHSLQLIGVRNDQGARVLDEKGSHALIAFVDNGIDVLHRAFSTESGQTRIVGIWDQNDTSGSAPAGFDYGTYHSRQAIDGYLKADAVPQSLGRNNDGHGTHVASIAAGRAVGSFAGGVAPEAQLLVVITKPGESIGYSKAHLDALAFINRTATELELPVVVNVSQGMNAGAHDGQSALEVAFDEFSAGGRKPGRVIVKSAGNERNKRGHAEVTMKPMSRETFEWKRSPDANWPFERLDLWWGGGHPLQFKLGSPAGVWSPPVSVSQPDVQGKLAQTSFALQLVKRHVDNGDSLLRVEIGSEDIGVPAGTWTLEIVSADIKGSCTVHAWIERAGTPPSEFQKHAQEKMTLSIPGTARHVITVGATSSITPIEVGDFSSYGPTRDAREKPDVAAPGVGVWAARGGTADEKKVDSGTSMAAPHVAGAIALVLSKAVKAKETWPTSTQLAAAIRQKTLHYNGQHDVGQGYGVLDASALLAAF